MSILVPGHSDQPWVPSLNGALVCNVCDVPVSHHGLLPSKILTKHRVYGGTCGFKGILIQVKTVEHSVMKSNFKKERKT